MDTWKKIKKAILEDGTVLFVGAGISVWSGIPGWGQLLSDMADYVDSLGCDSTGIRKYKDSQPLLAADIAKKELTKEQYSNFLKNEMRIKTSKPGLIHQLLLRLGGDCFITTNFDQLLEKAIRTNRKGERFQVITNEDAQKCMDICNINKRRFVFKPHGDIEDTESLILTNTDYREMYEDGERHFTYSALKMLLITRNVIFVGFGLTDPDFLRIMDEFHNEFKQSISGKYAIMPDVSNEEIDYWRNAYGIHILSYDTVMTENGRDYSGIFGLLQALIPAKKKRYVPVYENAADNITQKQRRALALYAQSVTARYKIDEESIFPMKIYKEEYNIRIPYISTEEMLQREEKKYILTGNPGVGKTFFLKRYCVAQAGRLFDWCQTRRTKGMPLIPVYIDLKSYQGIGSITKMMEEQFPEAVWLQYWLEKNQVLFILDSYNEIELRYWQDKACQNELEALIYNKNVVIASRTEIGDFWAPKYKLDEVEETYVEDYLEKHGMMNYFPVVNIFSSPLYFNLLYKGKVNIDNISTINDVYFSYFDYINRNIKNKWGITVDVIPALSELAFAIFKQGNEIFSAELVAHHMKQRIPEFAKIRNGEILNFLMDRLQFLIPLSDGKAMFFHQSVTEFLAAVELGRDKNWKQLVEEYLTDLRWNQLFLFAAGLFGEKKIVEYIWILLQADSLLAIQAAEYLQAGKEECTAMILEYLYEKAENKTFDYFCQLDLLNVCIPTTAKHETILWKLIGKGDLLGGIAAGWLLDLRGKEVKDKLTNLLLQYCNDDYNFVTRTADKLCEYITLEDYKTLIFQLQACEMDSEDRFDGIAQLSACFTLEEILEVFSELPALNHALKEVLAEILRDISSQKAFRTCLQCYLGGWNEMLFSVYMYIKYEGCFAEEQELELVARLICDIDGEDAKWAIGLLHTLYHRSDIVAKYVRSRLKYTRGILKLVFYYVIGKNRTKSFFDLFRSMLYYKQLPEQMINAFDEVDWEDNLESVIKILYGQNRVRTLSSFLGELEMKNCFYSLDAESLLMLLMILKSSEDNFCRHSIGKFVGKYTEKNTLLRLYTLFENSMKTRMHFYVLPYNEHLKKKDFTEKTMELLLEDLRLYDLEDDIVYTDEILLVNIADDAFIQEKLFPMLERDGKMLKRNIEFILKRAGEAHSKRYIRDS